MNQAESVQSRPPSVLLLPPSPPPKPGRGIIPPPYRQPPPPPGPDLASTNQCSRLTPPSKADFSRFRSISDASHVYKNVAELAMYSDKLVPPPVPSSAPPCLPAHAESEPAESMGPRMKRFQQPAKQAPSNGSSTNMVFQEFSKSNADKPVLAKKPGFIQQRLRSLLPNGLSESKKTSAECDQPKNNAIVEADPLILTTVSAQSEGFDNPGHSAMDNEASYTHSNNGELGQFSDELASTYSKNWPKPTVLNEDSHSTPNLRSTCTKIFQRTPASILAKNTTTSQEFDKVGQKEGVMKQLEQLESKNQISSRMCANRENDQSRRTFTASASFEKNDRKTSNVVTHEHRDNSAPDTSHHQSLQSDENAPTNDEGEAIAPNLLPEQTYTIDKKTRNHARTDTHRGKEEWPSSTAAIAQNEFNATQQNLMKVVGQNNSGSMSSGVFTMPNSARNSDTTSTTSPEPDSLSKRESLVEDSSEPAKDHWNKSKNNSKQWNNVDVELRKIISKSQQQNGPARNDLPDVPPGTPPLPPISPCDSPAPSPSVSPKLHPKSKYKLSMSATALNKNPELKEDMYNSPGKVKSKLAPSSKLPASQNGVITGNRVRRTTTIAQGNCKQWEGPTIDESKRSSNSKSKIGVTQQRGSNKQSWHSPKISVDNADDIDQDMASTTTGLDMDSLLDGPETCYSSDGIDVDSASTGSQIPSHDMYAIRKQLEGLESMYSEVLKMLGSKSKPGTNRLKGISDQLKSSSKRKVVYGSLSSLSVASRSNNYLFDRSRSNPDKRRSKDSKSVINKRFQRLESHVVTLARSVAHLSSEMRSQHMMYQEIESLRRDFSKMREEQQQQIYSRHSSSTTSSPTPRPTGGGLDSRIHGNSSQHINHRNPKHINARRHFQHSSTHSKSGLSQNSGQKVTPKNERISLTNCSRIAKLTKFFGTEPPLLRQFLKTLGYEKYTINFESEGIGLLELPYLTDERFHKLGIPMGPRLRIMQEAQIVFSSNDVSVYIV